MRQLPHNIRIKEPRPVARAKPFAVAAVHAQCGNRLIAKQLSALKNRRDGINWLVAEHFACIEKIRRAATRSRPDLPLRIFCQRIHPVIGQAALPRNCVQQFAAIACGIKNPDSARCQGHPSIIVIVQEERNRLPRHRIAESETAPRAFRRACIQRSLRRTCTVNGRPKFAIRTGGQTGDLGIGGRGIGFAHGLPRATGFAHQQAAAKRANEKLLRDRIVSR